MESVNNSKLLLHAICDWSVAENLAIEYHDSGRVEKISYSELSDAKGKVETALASVIDNYTFVGINFDVKTHCVPALMLGIQYQGSAFVNLSPANKREICSKLGVKFIFSRFVDSDADLVCELNVNGEIINLLKLKSTMGVETNVKNEFAYAVTTSGSTGVAKIVKVPHASIVPNVIDLRELLLVSSNDKIAQTTSLTFDPCIVEIFLGLSSGGTLFVTSNKVMSNPRKLLDLIFEYKVTLLQTTPSLWQNRWTSDEIGRSIFGKNSYLRVLLLGGEPLPKLEILKAFKHPDNNTRIYNIYGVTEVSCWASVSEIQLNNFYEFDNYNYLGKPLSQTIFQLRNKRGDVVDNGEGILYIGSNSRICVIDNEDSTSFEPPVFRNTGDLVTINENGDIFYNGRCDRTVKRFGNRIDLSELESAVSKLNFVKNSVALWDEKAHKLYLCVSTVDRNEVEVKFFNELRLREEVKKQIRKLPAHYQPDSIKYFNNYKLTINGKICTRNLMKIFQNTDDICLTNSKNFSGEIFSDIWNNILTSNSRDDSGFLDHGGDSVKAIQISNELSLALNSQFPELIGLLLNNETFEKCVEYVKKRVCVSGIADNDDIASTSSLNLEQFESATKKTKQDFSESRKILKQTERLWQKCRGRVTGKMHETDPTESSNFTFGAKLNLEYTRDLKKCVDASPTVFGYPSGEIYTSVGSHSGIILTERLNHPDSIRYEINLPDRIEASVLALEKLKGIVGCYDGYVYCVDLKSGEIIWKFKTGDTVKCTAIESDDRRSVFVGSYDKYFYNISIKDGKEIWKLKGSEGSISATPSISSKLRSVVFGTLDGTCMSVKQDTGEIIWKRKLKDPIFSAPVVLENEDVVFCSVSGEVNCFNSTTGLENWRFKIEGNVFSHLVLKRDFTSKTEDLIIGSINKKVYCLSIQSTTSTPTLKYSVTFEYPIFATPYCEGEVIIVADTGGNLSLIDASNGDNLTSFKLNGDVFSSPVIIGDFSVVGCRDNNMYVLKIKK